MALYIDGVHFHDHVVVVSLGVSQDGTKHVLGLWEGATENGETCRRTAGGLGGAEAPADRTILAVIDGSKALVSALRGTFGKRVLIQRCQVHKTRNVTGAIPKEKRESVRSTLNQAYRTEDHNRGKRILENLARAAARNSPLPSCDSEEPYKQPT